MSDKTGIEWTDATWNPIRGCTRVSEGCRNCYAERVAARFSKSGEPYEGLARFVQIGGTTEREARWTGKVAFVEKHLEDPLRWRKPRIIFVNSMSDPFHENVKDEWICEIIAIMNRARQHTFQVLTKRPERMRAFLSRAKKWDGWMTLDGGAPVGYGGSSPILGAYDRWPLPNVWWGTSVEDQASADKRLPELLKTPAAVRWISAEPLLGPVDLRKFFISRWLTEKSPEDMKGKPRDYDCAIDWVVAGGESGPGARPMHPDWARSLRDQCYRASVPFFFKQWGEFSPIDSPINNEKDVVRGPRQLVQLDGKHFDRVLFEDAPKGAQWMERVGKKAAGRLLDGREWNEYPKQGTA